MKVRHREPTDLPVVKAFLADNHSTRVARLGRMAYPLDHPALLAETDDGTFAGLLTYVPDPDDGSCEILTLQAVNQGQGAGTALISAVERVAAEQGIRRLWLITTNDNVDALRFYRGAASGSRTYAWAASTSAEPGSSRRSPRSATTAFRFATR